MYTLTTVILAVTAITFFVFLFGQARPGLALPCLGIAACGFGALALTLGAGGERFNAAGCAVCAAVCGGMLVRETRRTRRTGGAR